MSLKNDEGYIMYKFLGTTLFLNFQLSAMQPDSLDGALKAVEETKVKHYKATLAEEFARIKAIDFENLPAKEFDNGMDSVIKLVCGDSDYAPLLKCLLQSKRLNPNFSWTESYNTSVGSTAGRRNLLGAALYNKAPILAQILVEHGADINFVLNYYSGPLYPLNAAIDLNAPTLVRAILAKNPDISYTKGVWVTQFPLSRALITLCCRNNRDSQDERKKAREIIENLLAFGCSPSQKHSLLYPATLSLETHFKWDHDTSCAVTTPLEIIKAYNQAFRGAFNEVEQLLMEKSLKAS